MDLLEILDCRGAAQVEQVLAHTYVASAVPFASRDVSQSMLDGNALAVRGAPRRRFRNRSRVGSPILEILDASRGGAAADHFPSPPAPLPKGEGRSAGKWLGFPLSLRES
jgi:hypothetical protein